MQQNGKHHIGKTIRALRRTHKLTQEQLAQLLKCNRLSVTRYEIGHVTPPLYVAQKIAEIFDLSLDELLAYEPVPIPAIHDEQLKEPSRV